MRFSRKMMDAETSAPDDLKENLGRATMAVILV